MGWPVRLVVVDASAMVEVAVGRPGWARRFADWQETASVLVAPAHFRVEMANALLLGVKLDPLDVIGRVRQLFAAGIDVVDRGLVGLADAVELAARHHLSVYDATYLALAIELEGELATMDRALAKAARAEAVTVIEPATDPETTEGG